MKKQTDKLHGVYQMTLAEYHGHTEAISKSGLDLIARSPAHYRQALAQKREPTDYMVLGSLTHTLILEPERIEEDFFVTDLLDRRGNAWKAAQEEAGTRARITAPMYQQAKALADRVLQNQWVTKTLANGKAERSIFWTDAQTGVLCKARPDMWREDLNILVDLKTTDDAREKAFSKSIINNRYHVQCAHYCNGVEAVTGKRPRAFVLIAIERDMPHECALYELDADLMARGVEECARNLNTYAECLHSNQWPGYNTGLTYISAPMWA